MEFKGFIPVGYADPAEHARLIEALAAHHLAVIGKAAKAAGVRCKLEHATNDFPADAITAAAVKNKCDLIFMSSHGHHGFTSNLLGSQTQKVLAASKVTVVVHR